MGDYEVAKRQIDNDVLMNVNPLKLKQHELVRLSKKELRREHKYGS
jgi:hypothetical protein